MVRTISHGIRSRNEGNRPVPSDLHTGIHLIRGLVITASSGIASLSATDSSKALFKDAPVTEDPGNSRERIFRGKRLTVIPFIQGETLVLQIKGSGKAEALLWKVLPEGINAKNYSAGQWEKGNYRLWRSADASCTEIRTT